MRLLSFGDLYGGKMCAALDRQHPRDLFDIQYLQANEGITKDLKDCFLVFLISHNRPMAELLDPTSQDIEGMYENEFVGMTTETAEIEELYNARDVMVSQIHALLDEKDKEFLLSLKNGNPEWKLFAHPAARHLPAIQWKLHNISKMSENKRLSSHEKLKQVLLFGPSRLG